MPSSDETSVPQCADRWLAVAIGNSRLHWAAFSGNDLEQTWNTPHLSIADVQQLIATQFALEAIGEKASVSSFQHKATAASDALPLWIASVVPEQTRLWQAYPAAHIMTLEDVPLTGLYPTLGIDRALAVWGAIVIMGSPVLVIDAGTALTFTAADGTRFMGGAILPGLGLQFHTLNQATAALPDASAETLASPQPLPPRWALHTADAIASGIIYTVLAGLHDFVTDWWQQFPDSPVLLRGGDSDRLYAYLAAYAPAMARKMIVEPHLIFWGLRSVREERLKERIKDKV